jgi:hypothetical protein
MYVIIGFIIYLSVELSKYMYNHQHSLELKQHLDECLDKIKKQIDEMNEQVASLEYNLYS